MRKVDPRKDAHSNLLTKNEESNLYKIQCKFIVLHVLFSPVEQQFGLVLSADLISVHNVKPECLDAYNKLWWVSCHITGCAVFCCWFKKSLLLLHKYYEMWLEQADRPLLRAAVTAVAAAVWGQGYLVHCCAINNSWSLFLSGDWWPCMTSLLLRPTSLIPKMTGGQPLVFRDSFYLWMWNMRGEMYDDCDVDLCVCLSLKETWMYQLVTLYFNHISVRMFCPPSTLISTTPVSWWVPGIPGMENKTRLVGLYNTRNISVLHGLHSLQVSRLVILHSYTQ